jgi:hypothetical protein
LQNSKVPLNQQLRSFWHTLSNGTTLIDQISTKKIQSDRDANEDFIFSPLKDEASEEDLLGKGFDSLASHIQQMVSFGDGGICVGLLGRWGAGKSSVIKMLKAKLKEDEQLLFVFDAWVHENDYLRRAFIESLVQCLLQKKWIKEHWKMRLEILAGRLTEKNQVEINATTIISWSAVAILSVISLFYEQLSSYLSLGILRGLVLITATWLCLLIFLFKSKMFSSKVSLTALTGDITSIEFEKAYKEILSEALKDPKKKLVICIDNLDRLESSQMQHLWSTMRVFTDSSNLVNNEDWLQNLFVIVPFDPKNIGKLWSDSNDGDTSTRINKEEIAESFIGKTFQLLLDVPSPPSAYGISYMKTQFEQVLRNHFESRKDEISNVITIYRLLRQEKGWTISPRKSKLFVNSVASYFFSWKAQISLSSIAAYVIWKEELIDWKSLFYDAPAPNSVIEELLPTNWRDELLSLHFNLPSDEVRHMLIENILKSAFDENETSELVKTSALGGFSEVFAEHFNTFGVKESVVHLGYAANVLLELEKSESLKFNLTSCWKRLLILLLQLKKWHTLNNKIGFYLQSILKKASPISSTQAQVLLRNISTDEADINHTENWIGGLNHILTEVKLSCGAEFISENFKLPIGLEVKDYVGSVADNLDEDLIQCIHPIQLDDHFLVDAIQSDEFSDEHYEVIRHTVKYWSEITLLRSTGRLIESVLRAPDSSTLLLRLKSLLILVPRNDSIHEALRGFCWRGIAFENINASLDTGDPFYFTLQFQYVPTVPENILEKVGDLSSDYLAILNSPSEHMNFLVSVFDLAKKWGFLDLWCTSDEHCNQIEFMSSLIHLGTCKERNLSDLPAYSKLRKLKFSNIEISREDFKKIETFDNLRHLEISDCRFKIEDIVLPKELARILVSEDMLSLEMRQKLKEHNSRLRSIPVPSNH